MWAEITIWLLLFDNTNIFKSPYKSKLSTANDQLEK